jgi:hypothetical protein
MISDDDYINFEDEIKAHDSVQWVERQKRLVRNKRDYISKREIIEVANDPLWSETWYLNRKSTHDLPDMNVTGAWALGYTGKGVLVSFLDDGLERDHPDLIENYVNLTFNLFKKYLNNFSELRIH